VLTPPPRKSRAWPIVLGVVGGLTVMLVLIAVVVQSAVAAYRLRESAARSASATRTPTGAPPTVATPTFTPYSGNLADLLLPLPSGATPLNPSVVNPDMTEAQRVSFIWNSDDPTWMSNQLTEYNFRQSADREWSLGGSAVFLVLLQFFSPSDATDWYNVVSIQGFSGTGVESTGPSIGTSILTSRYCTIKYANGHRAQVGLALDGQFAILIEVATGSPQTDFPTMQSVAVGQYQRLPAP
jgi:hypothetical protein